jgi:hypothetical protein
MPIMYQSGEEVRKGDRVTYCGAQGVVEFVADPQLTPEDWFVQTYGGGVMLLDSQFGSVFLDNPAGDEDLLFVGRQG